MNNQKSNLGVTLGIILCALVFLTFPRFTGMIAVVAWIFYGIGLCLLLLGLLGACVEWFQ
jgi:uncharacterized membrane protein YgaE (UPF0421/DUF939 family)